MPLNATSPDHLRRIFTENFSVSDIAEPLASFDADTPAPDVRRVMDERRYELAGVRRDGLVVGYVQREEVVVRYGHDYRDGLRAGRRNAPSR